MGLHRLMGMKVGVPDPEGLAAYYGELGLEGDGSSFGGTDGGAQVDVEHHAFRRLLEVTVAAGDDGAVASIAARLRDLGLAPRATGDTVTVVEPVSRVTFAVTAVEPATPTAAPASTPTMAPPPGENRPGVAVRHNVRAPGVFDGPRPPRRLGHLVIGTPDIAATRDLLVQGLGFKVSDQMEGVIAFLRCSTDHHNVALVGSPVPMLQHYSWECDDVDHVGHAATAMIRTDHSRHAWGFGRHFIGSNFYWYLKDPSGSFLELYSDMDVIDDDEAWEAGGRTPFGFEMVANSWGPDIPAEFIVPEDLAELKAAWAARG